MPIKEIPYQQHQNTEEWAIIANLLAELKNNQDIELKTAPEYVVGYLVERLRNKGEGQELQKKVKELEIKIISLQETNQILRKDLGYWQDKQLEKELKAHKETIKKLQREKQELIEKYTRLENQRQNSNNYLSMPNLYALISKHKKFQTIQKVYNHQEIKEREFLKKLLNELWSFAG